MAVWLSMVAVVFPSGMCSSLCATFLRGEGCRERGRDCGVLFGTVAYQTGYLNLFLSDK